MTTLQPVLTSHIVIDEAGVARLAATPRYKVRHIIVERTALGMSPEQIVAAHPDVLSLAEVHAALAYYCDHQAAMDAQIAADAAEGDRLYEQVRDRDWETGLAQRMGRLQRESHGS